MKRRFERLSQRDLEDFGLVEPLPESEANTRPAQPKSDPGPQNEPQNVDEGPVEKLEAEYRALEFKNGAELIAFFDKAIREQVVILHQWQVEENENFASAEANSQHPFKYALCAANGSGKDAFVIAPFVIWFALCNVRSLCVITSSSGVQLSAQTENYIKRLATLVNSYFGTEIFRIRQRYIVCRLSGSEIRLFATDEAGKAEGYHPLEPNAKMAIIVNEAKSIDPDIISALRRCTGFTHWIYVSTPGAPSGDFHKACETWPHFRRVDYYDCPHLSQDEFEADKKDLGEHSPLFRSKWLALFTSIGENIVIPREIVNPLIANPPKRNYQWWPLRIGLDLAAGGDENTMHLWQGNTKLKEYYFREHDTTVAAQKINDKLEEWEIPKTHEYIFADDGGIGRAIIDMLRSDTYGWNINRVLNNGAPKRKKEFGNRGAELWFKLKRFIELKYLRLDNVDEKCIQQLCDRRFRQPQDNRLFLQPKSEARAEGRQSPDRADALVLAFTDVSVSDFDVDNSELEDKKPTRVNADQLKDAVEAEEFFFNRLEEDSMKLSSPSFGSINVLTKRLQSPQHTQYYGRHKAD